jgi:hypothetical protein
MKQETLEVFAKKYANDWEEIHPELDPENMTPIEVSKIDFIEGAKWQQERSYSEEEVDELISLLKSTTEYEASFKFRLKVEQFKKK